MTSETKRTLTLDVKDRLIIGELLPQQSNLQDQLVSKDISKKIVLTQEEMAKVGLKQDGQNVNWNDSIEHNIDVEFSEAEMELLTRMTRIASEERRITRDMVDTILKIQRVF